VPVGSVSPVVGGRTLSPPPAPKAIVHVSPPSATPVLDVDHEEDASLWFRRVDDVLGPVTVLGMVERALHEELHLVSAEEPTSLKEDACDPSWRAAMVEELHSIKENKTWERTSLPTGHRPIGLKWVYKAKRDEQGNIVKHKARLIAKGYVQKQGIDYEEAFTLMARM
jgi:hypothetical protein